MSDILSLLKENMSGFSKGQKRIAQYILESYDKAAFMTANKLAQMVGVSESTVVRFAVDLGFDGFPSMQKTMQEMVLNRLTSVQRIEVANDRMKDQDVISTVFHSDMEKLRQTEETVSREEFGDAVAAILKAKRVYIIGVRSVAPLAMSFSLSCPVDMARTESRLTALARRAAEAAADLSASKAASSSSRPANRP